MRPLYLDGREPLSVSLGGPALCVRGLKRADGRYPLGRVSRVMVGGIVHWQTEALLACMKAGIMVCFMDADGVLVGHCVSATQQPTSLSRRLDELLDRPDWETLYRNWCESAERNAILTLQRRLRIRFPSLRARDVRKNTLAARHSADAVNAPPAPYCDPVARPLARACAGPVAAVGSRSRTGGISKRRPRPAS